MMLAPSCDDFSIFSINTDMPLCSTQETHARKSPRSVLIGEDTYPRDTKWLMKKEKCRWFEGDSVIFDTNTYTIIIISEFFETNRWGENSIVGDVPSEEFFPFAPISDIVSYPGNKWPNNGHSYEDDKKYFHGEERTNFITSLVYCKLEKNLPKTIKITDRYPYEKREYSTLARNCSGNLKKIDILQRETSCHTKNPPLLKNQI